MTSPPPSTTPPSPPPPSTTAPPPPPPPPPVPRKFPAPCWTHDETLALIASYRDKWYSLRRRNLRTADWESVAADVTRRCPPPPSSPAPKTSAQCRHKMEKLRKRYRTEKQRLLSLPINHHNRLFSPASSWVFFDLMDSMEAGTDPATHNHNPNPNPPMAHINPNPSPNAVFVKAVVANPNPNPNPNPVVDSKPDLGKYLDEILTGGPIKIRVKNHRRFEEQDNYGGGARNMNQSGPPAGYKRVYPGEEMEELEEREELLGKRVLSSNGGRRKEERRDSVAEMVSSIKMLGEGLVRMEKMKMDMMREIERMRMEMEMKRSEMILESQQLIVNAFVEGMKKNKKPKLMEVE